jgi:hypothetical protein
MTAWQIVAPDPAVSVHVHAFDEVLRVLVSGLARLGIASRVTLAPEATGEPTIIVAPHRQAPEALAALPRTTILYSWEPIGFDGSTVMSYELMDLMTEFVIWDYSEKNVEFWRELGADRVVHVPLGYDASIVSLTPTLPEPDLDVLFYGSMNDRRAAVLNQVRSQGVQLGTMFGGFGIERDAAISRAKLVVNLHFYDVGILELPRMSYLWANRKPVISEVNPTTEVPFGMRDHMLHAPYGQLADAIIDALSDPHALREAADRAFDHFSVAGDAQAILAQALAITESLTARAAA